MLGLNADWPNRLAKVSTWQFLNGNAATMKEYIATYGAITACLDVYQDFFSYGRRLPSRDRELRRRPLRLSHRLRRHPGCWIAKNSWGPGWGDGGHFRIAYGECRIESYQTCGVSGHRACVRAWLPDQQILGLWSNEYDANVWAYGATRGWLKVDGGNVTTNLAMFSELAAAKAGSRPVGLFEDNGSVNRSTLGEERSTRGGRHGREHDRARPLRRRRPPATGRRRPGRPSPKPMTAETLVDGLEAEAEIGAVRR